MRAVLLLEDGRRFEGRGFGASVTRVGEAVFNTAMTGYQEVLTDPSYAEQVICMTSSHIGNTGVNPEDLESSRIWASGFIVRALSPRPSNWRATGDLHGWLVQQGIPGLAGVDTRALTQHLRTHGAQRCAISTEELDDAALRAHIEAWPGMAGRALASEVCCRESWVLRRSSERLHGGWRWSTGGAKRNILRLLAARPGPTCGCTRSPTRRRRGPSRGRRGVRSATGPAIRRRCPPPSSQRCAIVVGKAPCLGICLGHQLLALALGATTYKLKFGHRGANQPVRDERTGKSRSPRRTTASRWIAPACERSARGDAHHLNDGTVSGFQHRGASGVRRAVPPRVGPGPHDSRHLFQQFIGRSPERAT
jgi:carbamoyl-phosphate synthase small subunit